MSKWHPIDTLVIPPEGICVLVYMEKERHHSRVSVGYFRPNVAVIGGLFRFDQHRVTHWMPLPDPPEDI